MQQVFALTLLPSGHVSLRPVTGSEIACQPLLTFRDTEAAQRFLDNSHAVRTRGGATINGTYQMDVPTEMKILSVNFCAVEIEDSNGNRSSVFQQGDKRLKCLSSKCKSRNHFRCEHVEFVQSQHVVFPELPPLTEAEIAELID